MNPSVSVISVTHDRSESIYNTFLSLAQQDFNDFELILVEDGDSGGYVERAGRSAFPSLRYLHRKNRPHLPMSNPAVPINIGLKHAMGSTVVLLSGDCKFPEPTGLGRLLDLQGGDPLLIACASIRAISQGGSSHVWFSHPEENPRRHFAATAFARELAMSVGGFDEDFEGYGFDDDDFEFRLQCSGAKFILTDVVVDHQWHVSHRDFLLENNQKRYEEKKAAILRGERPAVANIGRDWGNLES
jgi:glycosyltransferase involved in cell wall biosynthesis